MLKKSTYKYQVNNLPGSEGLLWLETTRVPGLQDAKG